MRPFDDDPTKGGIEQTDSTRSEGVEKTRFSPEVLKVSETGEPEVLRIVSEGFDTNDAVDIQPEAWRVAEDAAEATAMTLRDVMTEQAGFTWDDGMNAAITMNDAVELLEKECYVQVSRFTPANISACLKNDGSVLAYVPEQAWRQVTAQETDYTYEVPGMHVVQIVGTGNDCVTVADHALDSGQWIEIDADAVSLISQNGWILEVYK